MTVVEITPIGIQNLRWRFYILWTLLNLAFVPIVYIFYPETAGRSLEDLDRLFRENHNILVFQHKEAISSKRPAAYVEHHEREVRRNSRAVSDRAKVLVKANEEAGFSHEEQV